MTVIELGMTTLSGDVVPLKNITALTLASSLTTPVTQLTASLAIDSPVEGVRSVQLFLNGDKVFLGGVDHSTTSFDQRGGIFTIEARSLGAKALDNEARPDNLWGANVSAVFARYLSGHGLSLINHLPPAVIPQFIIGKGMSQWEVFRRFALRAYLIEPYVVGDIVYLKRKSLESPALIFGQKNSSHLSYTAIEKTLEPYNLLSKIYLRDSLGEYSSSLKNPLADSFGVTRERYMIPTDEYTLASQTDARLQNSNASLEEYSLKTPNLVFPKLGSTVEVQNSPFGTLQLIVEGCQVRLGRDGVNTKIILKGNRYNTA